MIVCKYSTSLHKRLEHPLLWESLEWSWKQFPMETRRHMYMIQNSLYYIMKAELLQKESLKVFRVVEFGTLFSRIS